MPGDGGSSERFPPVTTRIAASHSVRVGELGTSPRSANDLLGEVWVLNRNLALWVQALRTYGSGRSTGSDFVGDQAV